MSQRPPIREATAQDIPTLVRHRRLMFEDMAAAQSLQYGAADLDSMEQNYSKYLRAYLPNGTVQAWVAEVGGEAVASGTISILVWPPAPALAGEQTALLHSMYTAPPWRRRGIGRRIAEAAISFCQASGCKRVVLGGRGSDAGRHLYESLGFRPGEQMQLKL